MKDTTPDASRLRALARQGAMWLHSLKSHPNAFETCLESDCVLVREPDAAAPPLTTAAPSQTLNLNDHVWVKLREKGRDMLREADAHWSRLYATAYGKLPSAEKQEAENDGWSRWQLWGLIEAFGPEIHIGNNLPIETTIRLESAAVPSGWRPIATAPKDGSFLVHYNGAAGRRTMVADGWMLTLSQQADTPHHLSGHHWTHWLPLPAPPASLEREK